MKTLIRRRVLRRLIWVCTVCLCTKNWTLGKKGLKVKFWCQITLSWVTAFSINISRLFISQTLFETENHYSAYLETKDQDLKDYNCPSLVWWPTKFSVWLIIYVVFFLCYPAFFKLAYNRPAQLIDRMCALVMGGSKFDPRPRRTSC